MNEDTSKQQWVLVEGPPLGAAEFLGRWLMKAAAADKLLQRQFKRDPAFKLSVATIEFVNIFTFSPTATKCIELLMKDLTFFSMSVFEEPWGDTFAVMAEIGFFSKTDDRYQMTVPKNITYERIKAALQRLVLTQDEDDLLHPEDLVHCLAKADVQNWQLTLRLERPARMH
ncbi:hypothetical protein [Bradyrhizobium sp. S3.7.6]